MNDFLTQVCISKLFMYQASFNRNAQHPISFQKWTATLNKPL